MRELIEPVASLMREAAETTLMPVFGLPEAKPVEKSPGEWVTVADRACEELLTPALAALVPGSTVVGEEAAFADPSLLDVVGAGWVWLLDPLDGTSNFAAGRRPFAMLAALARDGDTVAAWVLDPVTGEMFTAERGSGAWRDGERVRSDPAPVDPAAMQGAVMRRFLPADLGQRADRARPQFGDVSAGVGCAGRIYPDVVVGDLQFAVFWRTLPWDHAAGCLLTEEAGGMARRLDGRPFRPGEHTERGLLVAQNPDVWQQVAGRLLFDRGRP